MFGKPRAKPLRLMAEDADDLPAISALIQDAALRFGDMAYDRVGRHFTVRMNRFCHELDSRQPLRAPSVLRVSGVGKVQIRGLDPKNGQQHLSLLDVSIEPLAPPAAVLILRFAGEGTRDIRIETECVDVLLLDLAAPHRAKSTPHHPYTNPR
ncbi:DUF2948 family protein [Asticcacaulis sp. AC402]|uniref:DUF2948 family protein n=1 Tax=Asticcacaulis sp. AC402 TaxID=1282361 RepID=UPI0003C404C5|nr:DUF2948 family protein [Asticcacaulis sp. AC402]ESQ73937.1 hypothetical protein ABAC402_16955 [Asticcacaulis sp. AC402]